ncbi:cupin domain-containing protein [Croceicoccus bisphenolivorans]|uniref:cupin domain-containing protein n=1 Tax=Croceicoccus bisphenolivorans TaxID=1783232 RepID=UPI00082BB87C|nr:cupin domain-containing protein [Croceicoccus bisphenolivorans]
MPGQVYSGTVADLPRETRFSNNYHRTGLAMDAANVCFVWLDPDAFAEVAASDGTAPCHSHPFDMMIYVIEGELRFRAGDKDHYLSGGDFIYVPRDVLHGGRPANGKPVHLMEMFAPLRTDYLYICEHQLGYKQAPRNADGSRVDTRSVLEAAADMGDSLMQPTE